MSQIQMKEITVDNLQIKIGRFGWKDGFSVRTQLIRCLGPSLAQLAGEGLKSSKKVDKKDVLTLMV